MFCIQMNYIRLARYNEFNIYTSAVSAVISKIKGKILTMGNKIKSLFTSG